jgi:hypothetical protein
MSSLKQTRHSLETSLDLKALVGAVEQLLFFEDIGSKFERDAALRYLADKLQVVKRNAASREAESQDDSTG